VLVSVHFVFERSLLILCFFLNHCFSSALLVCLLIVIFLASWYFATVPKAHHYVSEHRWCSHGRGFMQWVTKCLIVSLGGSAIPNGYDPGRCYQQMLGQGWCSFDVPFMPLVGSASLCHCGDCSSMCLWGYSHVTLPVCQRIMTGLSVCEWCSEARFS
jgi:hypothetical protein